jgi:hypothetical protein
MAAEGFIDVNIRGRIIQLPKPQTERDKYRERFRKVVLMAGYPEGYAQQVLTEYFDCKDWPLPANEMSEFVTMLEDYEKRYAEDGEII